MRIALLSVHSSPLARLGGKETGGMNVYVRELAHELGQQGLFVDIFTRSQERAAPLVTSLSPNVRVVNVHTGPAAPYDKNQVLTYLPEFVSRTRCFADGEDLAYDLIHSHYWLSGEAALKLRQSWGIPIVHMFHTLGAMKNNVARSAEETETSQRIAIERRLMQECDMIVAATPLDRAQMAWHYGAATERIAVIPCGVDLSRFHPQDQAEARSRLGLEQHQCLLLCVGRMEPLKGMDNLIRTLALLQRHHPNRGAPIRALLVGGEPETRPERWNTEQRRLDRLRHDLGVAGFVTFVGSQPHEALPDYYAAADVVIVPSHYESFGMAALEALASGAAVVASNVGGLTSTIEDGHSGLLVPPDDSEALADRIAALLTDKGLWIQLRTAARQRAQHYGWPKLAQQHRRLYYNLIEHITSKRASRHKLAGIS